MSGDALTARDALSRLLENLCNQGWRAELRERRFKVQTNADRRPHACESCGQACGCSFSAWVDSSESAWEVIDKRGQPIASHGALITQEEAEAIAAAPERAFRAIKGRKGKPLLLFLTGQPSDCFSEWHAERIKWYSSAGLTVTPKTCEACKAPCGVYSYSHGDFDASAAKVTRCTWTVSDWHRVILQGFKSKRVARVIAVAPSLARNAEGR